MTHEYTLLVGGTVLPGLRAAPVSAVAWAEGTILALGDEDTVRGISRGDSHVIALDGAFVVPIGRDERVTWPPAVTLEVGGPATLAILDADPRPEATFADGAREVVAMVRDGRLVRGRLPARTAGPR